MSANVQISHANDAIANFLHLTLQEIESVDIIIGNPSAGTNPLALEVDSPKPSLLSKPSSINPHHEDDLYDAVIKLRDKKVSEPKARSMAKKACAEKKFSELRTHFPHPQ